MTNFQHNEEDASFFITDTTKDVQMSKTGEIMTWFSRSKNRKNLEGKLPSKEIFVSLPIGFALAFNKTYYVLNDSPFIQYPGYGYLCITFCTTEDKRQVLVTNHLNNPTIPMFNEIVVSKNMVTLIGFDDDKKQKEVSV